MVDYYVLFVSDGFRFRLSRLARGGGLFVFALVDPPLLLDVQRGGG